uniref:ADP-ribosylation factor n=1 Tax=Solanum tuberosum TaxID=4113 RepID=M1BEG0_SOLTU
MPYLYMVPEPGPSVVCLPTYAPVGPLGVKGGCSSGLKSHICRGLDRWSAYMDLDNPPPHELAFGTLLEKIKSQYSNLEGLPPDRIVPTVGLNIGRVEASNTKLVFWDLGGQPGLRSIWEKYYEEAHAVIYVVDAASPSRFEDSKSALEKVLRHEDLQGAPLLILANKQDLADAVSAEEVARYLDLKKLDERAYTFLAVSSYDGLGIKESVNWLVDVMERSKRTEMLQLRAGANLISN